MPNDEQRRSAPLLKAVGSDHSSAIQVSEVFAQTLEQMRAVLTPILGPQAVAALYRRCLHLCAADHPCFESLYGNEETVMNTLAVKTMLAQQSNAEARRRGDALITTFHTLLASLIGLALTEQLVGDYTASSMGGDDHQGIAQ
ncbi:hypothetical protein [Pseudomonas abietaniphila]|uniref:Uncharacterized protein n=1 Tax=Pseudomonas abietaniphila TaxID=89065 RepID=A0A1G8GEI2_9PSED|nr:hypothetical protein [Pseudomonas abietaniphila]SDH92812.1 hypothetical protein SAMN05216605_109115 [Pseudomonas abietaniphila]